MDDGALYRFLNGERVEPTVILGGSTNGRTRTTDYVYLLAQESADLLR